MKSSNQSSAILTRLFSSAVVKELAGKGRSPLLARLVQMTDLANRCEAGASVGDVFEAAFRMLKEIGQRDEYVYRAALIQKILLGKHSLQTASMLHEFRAGKSRADLVILNGTATVYEIKSERDSLSRLLSQVHDYLKVFATVNVIVGDSYVKQVTAALPTDVGILRLSGRYQIGVVRDAVSEPERICPKALFDSLRTTEAKAILRAMSIDVPDLPNTQIHSALCEIFETLDPKKLHAEMVSTLKRTRNLSRMSDLVDSLPRSLHAAALSVPISKSDHLRFVDAVRTDLDNALKWA